MELNALLQIMAAQKGSDLYLTYGAPPSMKLQGKLVPIHDHVFARGEVKTLAYEIMNAEQIADFEKAPEMNMAIAPDGIGRFRVNIFQQRNEVGMVIRHIETVIPKMEDLGLPEVLKELIMSKRGLILFVGGTGSGKSTSMASLIDYRNRNSNGHIITIEDPVEFVHEHKSCIITQREVGVDTATFQDALKQTLRQAPDVILIGEIRSQETMEHALEFAETGHLCISTLHANNANQALDRIINFFPEERHNQLHLDLSLNMRGIISQRLVKTEEGGRAAAIEILIGTATVADKIREGDVASLKEIMEKSENLGMRTFDGALYELYKQGRIGLDEALKNADSANNLKVRISLEQAEDSRANSGVMLELQAKEEDEEDDKEEGSNRE